MSSTWRTHSCVPRRDSSRLLRISTPSPHLLDMQRSRRRLPHEYHPGAPLFLTWHLHGSVPANLIAPATLSPGEAFVWLDRRLDTARSGPRFLQQPGIARIVVASILKGVELQHYRLFAWVIMPNHVHLLIQPLVAPSLLLKSLKGGDGTRGKSNFGASRRAFLAEGIVRSLGSG